MEKPTGLIKELAQGKDLAKNLQLLLHSSSPPETRDFLVQSILSCYDRALSSLLPNALSDDPLDPSSLGKLRGVRRGGDAFKRKRKEEPDMTELVRGLPEGQPEEDGYSWRKYGQKQILGAKYPRGYFRCTHRPVQGCLATKQVQRSDDDPSLFQVTYRGRHTCIPPNPISSKLANQEDPIVPPSPCLPGEPLSILDDGKSVQMDVEEHIFPPFSSLAPLTTEMENIDAKGTYSDAFPEQGISLEDFDFDLNQGVQENTSKSNPAEIFSAPMVFPLHELGFDEDFPFEELEFFS